MKTNVRESSIEVYYGVLVPKRLQAQQSVILKTMARYGQKWWSRRQIARAANMETSTVSARVNAMLAAGLLEEAEEQWPCEITKVRVHHVRIKPKHYSRFADGAESVAA